MALYIFSDAHLGCGDSVQEQAKIAKIGELFKLVKADGDRLIILGDLFEFWFEYKHTIPKDHQEVLSMLRDLVQHGIVIDYVSGNHDFWMGDFFQTQIGVSLHRDSLETEYAGKKLHLTHGDGLAKADRWYRLLKKIFRNKFLIRLYRKLPPDWAISLAKAVAARSRNYTSQRDSSFLPDYQRYAIDKLKSGFDLVAIGHLHIPTIEHHGDGVYVNSGDFINHFSYVKVDADSVRLEYLK